MTEKKKKFWTPAMKTVFVNAGAMLGIFLTWRLFGIFSLLFIGFGMMFGAFLTMWMLFNSRHLAGVRMLIVHQVNKDNWDKEDDDEDEETDKKKIPDKG